MNICDHYPLFKLLCPARKALLAVACEQRYFNLTDVGVIPQRAKFDILARPYVYVVDKDNVVHQRDITIQKSVQDDILIIEKGFDEHDKIILEGLSQVRDGATRSNMSSSLLKKPLAT
jgi:hypothetical protein